MFEEHAKIPKTSGGKPIDPEAYMRKKMSVDIDYADVACVGIKKLDAEAKILKMKDMEKWFKDHTLESDQFGTRYQFEFITFNGKQFTRRT